MGCCFSTPPKNASLGDPQYQLQYMNYSQQSSRLPNRSMSTNEPQQPHSGPQPQPPPRFAGPGRPSYPPNLRITPVSYTSNPHVPSDFNYGPAPRGSSHPHNQRTQNVRNLYQQQQQQYQPSYNHNNMGNISPVSAESTMICSPAAIGGDDNRNLRNSAQVNRRMTTGKVRATYQLPPRKNMHIREEDVLQE